MGEGRQGRRHAERRNDALVTDNRPRRFGHAPSFVAKSSRLLDGDIDRHLRRRLAGARPMLIRPCNMGGAQTVLRRMREVIAVRSDHHAVAGRQIEGLAGREIDARLGLEVARHLGSQDGIPGQAVAARQIDHQ